MSRGALLAVPLLTCLALPAAAQDVQLYRFLLGVDVPEPAAMAALGVGPPVRLGSAPKPVTGTLFTTRQSGGASIGLAIDLAPYWLAGGGRRDLAAYRSRSVAGRLARVFTKTVVSVGVALDPDNPSATQLAVAARATLHDPHDPVLNSRLVEDVAAAGDRDVGPIFARARAAMRARSWDPQVSAGWSMAATAGGASLAGDSLGTARHAVWLAAQLATGNRFDVLGLMEVRDVFRDVRSAVAGLGVRRKAHPVDVQFGLAYHGATRDVHPALAIDARLGTRTGAVLWIETHPVTLPTTVERRVRVGLMTRWFAAHDRIGS